MAMLSLFIIYFILNLSSFKVCEVGNLIASWDQEDPNRFIILIVDFADNNVSLIANKTPVDILLDVLKVSFDHIYYYFNSLI
jgi:hypothetical protein